MPIPHIPEKATSSLPSDLNIVDPAGIKKPRELIVRKRPATIPMDQLFRDGSPTEQRGPVVAAAQPRPSDPATVRHPLSPPRLERDLTERPGRSPSAWWAVLVVLLAQATAGWLLWRAGLTPTEPGRLPERLDQGLAPGQWAAITGCAVLSLAALGGLTRSRAGSARVLTRFGRYQGTVRRTGLVWISPLARRHRADVRLRHWRSEPLRAVDATGAELQVVVLVVWRVKDTARALFTVDDHTAYLREQIEAATARTASRLPADSFRETDPNSPTLRDTDAMSSELTRTLAAECRPVGIEISSARPIRIEYAPGVAAAMRRRQIAALDAQHRDAVLTSVLDAVHDTVSRLTERGLVSLDDYERKALVKDLTVAFYTARAGAVDTR